MPTATLSRRTFQKVRRNSRPSGQCEAGFWRPANARIQRLALRAAEKFDVAGKAKGRRNGPLGHVGLEVYRALWRRVDFKTGRLEPSIEWLMKTCRRSRAAIVGALRRLKAHGFIDWIRRFEWVDGPPGVRGPQVRQATNAYQLATPAGALPLIVDTIVPDDERTRLRERAAFLAECRGADFAESSLGRTLKKWANAFANNASLPSALNPASGFFE